MRVKPLPPAEACFIMGHDPRNGAYKFPRPTGELLVFVSDGSDWSEAGFAPPAWEHVSVSLVNRCPTWSEMDWVKDLFWHETECVIQFHVPKSEHINCHPFCLHCWKPIGIVLPQPPSATVAPRDARLKNSAR